MLGGAGFLPAEHADVTERNQESCSPCEGSCFTLSSMEVLKQWPDSSRQKAGRAFGSCSCSISELCAMRVAPCSSERLFNAGVRSWVHTWKTRPELPSDSKPARPCLQNASALSPDDVFFQIPSFPISRLVEWHKTHPSLACLTCCTMAILRLTDRLKYLVGRLCSIHQPTGNSEVAFMFFAVAIIRLTHNTRNGGVQGFMGPGEFQNLLQATLEGSPDLSQQAGVLRAPVRDIQHHALLGFVAKGALPQRRNLQMISFYGCFCVSYAYLGFWKAHLTVDDVFLVVFASLGPGKPATSGAPRLADAAPLQAGGHQVGRGASGLPLDTTHRVPLRTSNFFWGLDHLRGTHAGFCQASFFLFLFFFLGGAWTAVAGSKQFFQAFVVQSTC